MVVFVFAFSSLNYTVTNLFGVKKYFMINTVNPRISTRGTYFKVRKRQGAHTGGSAFLIFPNRVFIHHLRVNTNISC